MWSCCDVGDVQGTTCAFAALHVQHERGTQRTNDAFCGRCPQARGQATQSSSGYAVGKQLARSGTAIGANYRAVRTARSRAEFVAKLGIVVEEADESTFWLDL